MCKQISPGSDWEQSGQGLFVCVCVLVVFVVVFVCFCVCFCVCFYKYDNQLEDSTVETRHLKS